MPSILIFLFIIFKNLRTQTPRSPPITHLHTAAYPWLTDLGRWRTYLHEGGNRCAEQVKGGEVAATMGQIGVWQSECL